MRKITFFVVTLLLHGCATTTVTSFVDPALKRSALKNLYYSKPIVLGVIAPLDRRLKLENSIVSEFRKNGINAIHGTEIMPPTREHDSKVTQELIKKSGGDSLFSVTIKEGLGTYRSRYEAVLHGIHDKKTFKVWIGSVTTELKQRGFSYSQSEDAMFKSTSQALVKQIIKDEIIK